MSEDTIPKTYCLTNSIGRPEAIPGRLSLYDDTARKKLDFRKCPGSYLTDRHDNKNAGPPGDPGSPA